MSLTILHNQKGVIIQQEQQSAVKVTTDSLLATLGSLQRPGGGRSEHIATNQQPWLMEITQVFLFLPSISISDMSKQYQAACDMLAVGSAQLPHCSPQLHGSGEV
jgi:hypothetical protein